MRRQQRVETSILLPARDGLLALFCCQRCSREHMIMEAESIVQSAHHLGSAVNGLIQPRETHAAEL